MSRRPLPISLLLVLALPLSAQAPLSLHEAFRRADAGGYGNRMAAAGAEVAQARIGSTGRGILPSLRAEAGWMRSTDPLASFSYLMRQREVTPQAFDPSSLNHPSARSDVNTGIILEAPLFNADAWAGRAAAEHAAAASRANAKWVSTGTRLEVIRGYFGAVLASEQVATLDAARNAALAHVRQAESALANGVVTPSDVLLAQVKQGDLETQLVRARGEAALARLKLALLLGNPSDTNFSLPAAVPFADGGAFDLTPLTQRADAEMAEAGLNAARATARAADATLLPHVNGFARYDWHDPVAVAGGTSMWTLGVMATWSLYSGGSDLASRRNAAAEVRVARAGVEATQATAALEVQAAEIDVAVTTKALTIASSSVSQATEAHRIVARKYDGGLAIIAELLDAQAAEVATRLAEANARYNLLIAQATLSRTRGTDLTTISAALDVADGMKE